MKNILKTIQAGLIPYLAILFCLLSFSTTADAYQKKDRVRMKMYFAKDAAGDRRIDIALVAGSGRNMHGLSDAKVTLYLVANDSDIFLAELVTDTLGLVSLYLANDYVLPLNEEGHTNLKAEYAGSEKYTAASNKIEIMDLLMEMDFLVVDSVKYVRIKATRPDAQGNKVPVEELAVTIGVQRLYSILPIEKIETDEDGLAELEFPDNLPGNEVGDLTITAQVEDSDIFGTVDIQESVNWGIPVSYELKPLPRQLFTDEAPLWMIAGVAIALIGAWYHFFWAVFKLYQIKRSENTTNS